MLVFVAVAVGGLGIGFGVAATILMIKSRQVPPALPSALPPVSAAPSAVVEAPVFRGPMMSVVHEGTCPATCCGGEACEVSPANSGKKGCRPGATHCDECSSGLTCIPGGCGEKLPYGEEVAFHLSQIQERGSAGEPVDACKSQRDLWLCLRRPDDASFQCLPQREACSGQMRSPAGIRLKSDVLLRERLVIEVREGGPDGSTLAARDSIPHREGIQRRALCGGLKLDFEASNIASFTYFLDAPSDKGPAPVSVPRRAESTDAGAPSDAGTSDAPSQAELADAAAANIP